MTPLRSLVDAWFPPLLSHVWSSTIFLLIVLLVVVVLRNRLTATGRFLLVLIGIAKFAIPTALLAPAIRLFSSDAPVAFPSALQAFGGALRVDAAIVGPSPGLWPLLAIAVWASVAAIVIVRFSLTRHRLVALATRTALPPDRREVDALARARRRVGVARSIDIARTSFAEAPAVLRTFRPLVILPLHGCDDLSDDELESLLCHECAHVARHDNLVARIESLICAFFWFHPLIWIAQRITSVERERACDEVVAGTVHERETYLTALAKFCHSTMAPRLPGVSCMASAKLKERMDYVMNDAHLKLHAPPAGRLALIGSAALVLFTLGTAMIGGDRALAATETDRYSVRIDARRSGTSILLQGRVRDNTTQDVVAMPAMNFKAGESVAWRSGSTSSNGGLEVILNARPGEGDRVAVDVRIERDGKVVQRHDVTVSPTEDTASETPAKYSGSPLSLNLKDADIRDVIRTFGQITGLEVTIDDAVQGKVSVAWQNVPWDEAFDTLLRDNGLTYRIEGSTIHVTKK